MKHYCELPPVPRATKRIVKPTSFKDKALFNLRNFCTVWLKHFRIKEHFHSLHEVHEEIRRHTYGNYWYVIHPLSKFAFVRDCLYFYIWLLALYNDAFTVSYTNKMLLEEDIGLRINSLLTDPLLMVYCLLSFFIGYIDKKTGAIVLDPRAIAKSYVKTFFVFDFIGFIPVYTAYTSLSDDSEGDLGKHFVRWIPMIKCVRIITVLKLLHQYSMHTINNVALSAVLCLLFLTTYFIHVNNCLMYYVISIEVEEFCLKQAEWKDLDLLQKYLTTSYCTLQVFVGGEATTVLKSQFGYLWGIYINVSGYFYKLITISWLMTAMSSVGASTEKYGLIMQDIDNYAKNVKLPIKLKLKTLNYCSLLFGGKYYEGSEIYATFSEHIQKQLFWRDCKILSNRNHLLRELNLNIVENILLKSTRERYLNGDIIYNIGDQIRGMYLIIHGSLALILSDGAEYKRHLEEGESIGELAYVSNTPILATIIATEFTELLKLPVKDLNELCKQFPSFKKQILNIAERRIFRLKEEKRKSHIAGIADFIYRRNRVDKDYENLF